MRAGSCWRNCILAAAVVGLLALAACGDSSSSSSTTVKKVVVVPSVVSLRINSGQKFTATALDADGQAVTSATFTWSSSDTDLVVIDNDTAIATAKSAGTAKIYAKDKTYGVTSEAAAVTVTPQIASITLSPVNASIKVGETQQFLATATDVNGKVLNGAVFQWNISYSGVATIDKNGIASGISAGTALVTASSEGVTSPVSTLYVTN